MKLEELRGKIIPVLRRYEVKRASVFGPFVRGEEKEESDIDVLVEFRGRRAFLTLQD
jgi:predicted nucleotidyltransferase